jgi:pimeloyl-ACP methyl ester carboxylesterase
MAQLAHERVNAQGRAPDRWMFVLPGIFGTGRNWGSVVRRLVRERPDWGGVLIDLRQHGASQGFSPPHTIDAAARDVVALAGSIPAAAILGHSFGGKVALATARVSQVPARQLWVIDSTPERREPSGSAWAMLNILKSLPDHFGSRAQVIDALLTHGVEEPVAQWMTTNLESDAGGYRWRFDVGAMEALLLDFFRTDLWSVVESPPSDVSVHVVKAEASSVLSGDALERMERAVDGRRVFLHRVAGGHWVNADNPDALTDLLARHLPGD